MATGKQEMSDSQESVQPDELQPAAEEEIRRHRILFDLSTDAGMAVDMSGRFLWINAAAERLTGYDRAELIGQPGEMIIPDDFHEMVRFQRDRKLVQSEDVTTYRTELLRNDGVRVPIEVVSWRIGPRDQPRGIEAIVRDLSRSPEVQSHVAQRATMEVIGQLASGIAHDFNNILLVINGYASILAAQSDLPEHALEMTREILQAGRRAAQLTQQLLALSRRQSGDTERTDLNEVVQEAEWLLRRVLGGELSIEVVLEGRPLPVVIETGQATQALLNLVLNARDVLPKNGRITIRAQAAEAPAGIHRRQGVRYGRICVKDNGPGIPQHDLERIWEPFFTTKAQGTGLGLANVKAAAERAGGFVTVESEPGAGAEFGFWLPLADGSESHHAATTALVITGDAATSQLVRTMLQELGMAAILLDDSTPVEECLSRGADAGVVIVVGRLRDSHRLDLVEELTRLKPDLKVLLISGGSGEAWGHRLQPDWMLLRAPFTATEFEKILQELLAP